MSLSVSHVGNDWVVGFPSSQPPSLGSIVSDAGSSTGASPDRANNVVLIALWTSFSSSASATPGGWKYSWWKRCFSALGITVLGRSGPRTGNGTLKPTTALNRSGLNRAQRQATGAPQSCPTTTA